MVTAFFGVNSIGLVKILREGTKLTPGYFKDEILRQIYEKSCGSSHPDCPILLTLHYHNAPVHKAKWISERLAESEFVRLVHSPYSADLAPCDFFLFVYPREQLMQTAYRRPEELEQAIVRTIEDIARRTLLAVVAS
jgi:histone-lysine N-methyltransferase SETMAR